MDAILSKQTIAEIQASAPDTNLLLPWSVIWIRIDRFRQELEESKFNLLEAVLCSLAFLGQSSPVRFLAKAFQGSQVDPILGLLQDAELIEIRKSGQGYIQVHETVSRCLQTMGSNKLVHFKRLHTTVKLELVQKLLKKNNSHVTWVLQPALSLWQNSNLTQNSLLREALDPQVCNSLIVAWARAAPAGSMPESVLQQLKIAGTPPDTAT